METNHSQEAIPKRHGCLTTYLVLMIISNFTISIIYLFDSEKFTSTAPNASSSMLGILLIASLCSLVSTIALFNWKKWGFIGFTLSGIIIFGVNIMIGLGFYDSLPGLVVIGILYWLLQIGKEKKAWPHLE